MTTFFEKYTELCKKNGMSANGAAKEIGLPSSSVTNWKQGRMPQVDSLLKVAKYFSVSVDWLLGNTDEKKNPTTVSDDGRETDKRRRALKLIVDNMSSEEVEAFLKLFDR